MVSRDDQWLWKKAFTFRNKMSIVHRKILAELILGGCKIPTPTIIRSTCRPALAYPSLLEKTAKAITEIARIPISSVSDMNILILVNIETSYGCDMAQRPVLM